MSARDVYYARRYAEARASAPDAAAVTPTTSSAPMISLYARVCYDYAFRASALLPCSCPIFERDVDYSSARTVARYDDARAMPAMRGAS